MISIFPHLPGEGLTLDFNKGATPSSSSSSPRLLFSSTSVSVPARCQTSYPGLWTLWAAPGPEQRECDKKAKLKSASQFPPRISLICWGCLAGLVGWRVVSRAHVLGLRTSGAPSAGSA